MSRIEEVELTNMCMICDGQGNVLVQNKKNHPTWHGWNFPGGHVEAGESFYEGAVREVKEETGLDVKDLEACGMINWCKSDGSGRYLEFLYKTSVFSGQLSEGTDEGNIFWLPKSELYTRPLSPNFAEYLPVFFSDKYVEALGEWTVDDSFTGIKYFS